jgi:hypothetical protein
MNPINLTSSSGPASRGTRPCARRANSPRTSVRAWPTAPRTGRCPGRAREMADLAQRCRMAIPWRDGSPGCRTAAESRLARTAFTRRGHRVRQAEQRAGPARPRHRRIPYPRTRTRSAAAGDGRPRLPLPRPGRPRRAAQGRLDQFLAVRVLAGPRKVRSDLRLRRDPQGFPGPPGSRRHASARARRGPASMPPTAANA